MFTIGFSSPVGVFFLFMYVHIFSLSFPNRVFIPCRGILLVYCESCRQNQAACYVFIPCRGILLVYCESCRQNQAACYVFIPCRGILLVYRFNVQPITEFSSFSSPVGVFFLFILTMSFLNISNWLSFHPLSGYSSCLYIFFCYFINLIKSFHPLSGYSSCLFKM